MGLREVEYLPKVTPWERESEETPAFPSPWSGILHLLLGKPITGLAMGVHGAQSLWLPSHHPTWHSPGVTSTIFHEVKICQGAAQERTFCAGSLPILKQYPQIGMPLCSPCQQGAARSLLYCNWVSLLGLPSSQLSTEIIQKCTAASTTVQVLAEAKAEGNFQIHSLIILSARLLLAALSSSCNHFCSN